MEDPISLSRLKEIVDGHLKRELDIFEYVFKLEDNDLREFRQWYINHPYCRIIREVKAIVNTRAGMRNCDSERKTKRAK